ncbi:MAG TPA: phenylacetate-CoA oxygenase/reductase subunit PaaK [Saprospirales bacterium]|nr:phenylacetate-CoA oxygenase/reductase subunit PaaK [Saprospirales bacterium]HAW03357.1 phenylacetate-CoA oxygenase/reductase subunit PaaK [Saprospirales bacterium]
MSTIHKIKVSNIIKETEDCVSVSFDIPSDLHKLFSYIPGQYLTLEADIDGEKVRRSYSLCSAPHENKWKVAVKKVPQGKFSTYANDVLKAGDEVNVMSPMGNFKLQCNAENDNHYVSFAAGSGITPMLSMIKEVMETEPMSQFTVFYGNKNTESIIFREEIEGIKNKYLDRLSVHYVLSREKLMSEIFNGRIDEEKCRMYAKSFFNPAEIHSYYLCGPSQMIFAVRDTLKDLEVSENSIKFELFTTDDMPTGQKHIAEIAELDRGKMSSVKVTVDGVSFDFDLAYDGENVLDASLGYGADLPFACKGGVCCTCKAKLVKGEVVMDVNYTLEPDEIEAGYILTCQSHPRTETIEIDFDV